MHVPATLSGHKLRSVASRILKVKMRSGHGLSGVTVPR